MSPAAPAIVLAETCSKFRDRRGAWLTALAGLVGACGGEVGGGSASPSGVGGAASASVATGIGGAVVSGVGGAGTNAGAGGSAAGSGGASSQAASSASGVAASSATGTTSGAGGAMPIEPCVGQNPACPGSPPSLPGKGLVAIDRCAYPIADGGTWAVNEGLIATLAGKLTTTDVPGLLGALNRTAVAVKPSSLPGSAANVTRAFAWQSGDVSVAYWTPQGITGSADAVASGLIAGHHVVLVSWYHDKDLEVGGTYNKGVRLAVVDTTLSPPKYRLVLLVEPVAGNPPSFKPVPIHAGGLAWFGDYLYVADTAHGFRVFDLAHILAVDGSVDSVGYDAKAKAYYAAKYAYVVPQVGRYETASACSPIFSFVGLDRSGAVPALVSGEYCDGVKACATAYSGRLFHFPLDPATGKLAPGTSFPTDAFYMGERQVQGAITRAGTTMLSSSAPAKGAGALYVIPPNQPRQALGWIDSPEDLYQNLVTQELWGLSEAAGARYVFAVKAP